MDQRQQTQQQQQDLSQLPNPTEDNLTAILVNGFQQGQIYTRIASSVLVQLNPFHPGKVDLSDAILQDQVLLYKDGARLTTAGTDSLSPPAVADQQQQQAQARAARSIALPHAIQLATSAYLHMRRTGQDQSIITR